MIHCYVFAINGKFQVILLWRSSEINCHDMKTEDPKYGFINTTVGILKFTKGASSEYFTSSMLVTFLQPLLRIMIVFVFWMASLASQMFGHFSCSLHYPNRFPFKLKPHLQCSMLLLKFTNYKES